MSFDCEFVCRHGGELRVEEARALMADGAVRLAADRRRGAMDGVADILSTVRRPEDLKPGVLRE